MVGLTEPDTYSVDCPLISVKKRNRNSHFELLVLFGFQSLWEALDEVLNCFIPNFRFSQELENVFQFNYLSLESIVCLSYIVKAHHLNLGFIIQNAFEVQLVFFVFLNHNDKGCVIIMLKQFALPVDKIIQNVQYIH